MKILLTGANGQVGQAIAKISKQFTHELIACDKHSLDITNIDTIKEKYDYYKPDIIINAAAYTAVDKAESESELAFAINAKGPENLAQVCAAANIPLLHLSTDYIFDGKKTAPYVETDAAAPLGVYGESKWRGEQAIREICSKYIILRVSWVFGEYGNNFVKTMLRLMRERELLRVVADQQGCPTYADDIAYTLLSVANSQHWGTYHYCGNTMTTWHQFAEAIHLEASQWTSLAVTQIDAITTADYPTPAKRPQNSVLQCQKFIDTFALPTSDWRKGLQQILKQLLTANENIS